MVAEAEITIVSVLWQGAFRDKKYTTPWVVALKRQVDRWLKRPHSFVCLSNVEFTREGIITIPIQSKLQGWWPKIELFRPELKLGKRVLFLDLDVLVTQRLDELIDYPSNLVFAPTSSDWYGINGRLSAKGTFLNVSSTCFCFTPPAGQSIWTEWKDEYLAKYRGDQDWMGDHLRNVDKYPGSWFAKITKCWEGPPEDVKIISGTHGKREDKVRRTPWMMKLWS